MAGSPDQSRGPATWDPHDSWQAPLINQGDLPRGTHMTHGRFPCWIAMLIQLQQLKLLLLLYITRDLPDLIIISWQLPGSYRAAGPPPAELTIGFPSFE
jgi:hypothetical protein